jgi:TatD DNase family protein
MPLIDTHCHYNLSPLVETWPTQWAKAQAHGVTASLVVGTDLASNQLSLDIAKTDSHLLATLGFHPGAYDEKIDQLAKTGLQPTEIAAQLKSQLLTEIEWLDQHLSDPAVVAVGETGLDFFHFDQNSELNDLKITLQKQAFLAQIHLANQHQLPLIIHARDKTEAAYRETLALIQDQYQHHRPFILHCASGPLDYIKTAVELGAYIGFDGNLTYKNNQPLLAIFHQTPANRRLLETDAPFLPPEPHRGQRCEPWMISLTAEYCEKNLGVKSVQFTQNALDCFGLAASLI